MALPAGALGATVTVGSPIDIAGTAGTLVSLRVRPEVPAGLVWAADGIPVEPWSASAALGGAPVTTLTLTILADQEGVLTSGTVDGAPQMVVIRSWPLVAEWRTKPSADAAPTKHVRRFAAPAPGTTVDLDLLPQDGALPPATITTVQSLDFSTDMVADLSIGTVTTGAAGTAAGAALTPDGDAYTLDLTIPRGDTGATGASALVFATTIAGVVADGVTDCTAPLNAWLASPPAGAAGLWFPPGTYVASLKVASPNLTISGARGSIIKVPSAATQGVTDAAIRILADDVTVTGMTINGNQVGNPGIDGRDPAVIADGIGIYANGATITNNHIYDPIGHGIIVWGLGFDTTPAGLRSGYLIHGNRVEGGRNRASVDVAFNQGLPGETKGVISNNRITKNTFVLHSANDVVVSGNYCEGMSFHTGCERLSVTGNVNTAGVLAIRSGHDVTLSGNITQTLEVKLGTETQRSTNITITGNRVTTVLHAENADGVTVANNTSPSIATDGCAGVVLDGNRTTDLRVGNALKCNDVTVSSNHAPRLILGDVENFTVSGNLLAGSTAQGINVSGPALRGTIRANRIRNTTGAGIEVGVGSGNCNDLVVAGNDMDTIGTVGVSLGIKATDIQVIDNRFRAVAVLSVQNFGVRTILRDNGRSYGRLVVPPSSVIAEAPAVAWPSANSALFSRFTLEGRTVLRYARFSVGVSSGNVQVGVVRFTHAINPAVFTRVMNSGVIACPASGIARIDLGAYEAAPGDYAVFLWADNATFTTPVIQSAVARTARLCSIMANQAAGIPATGSIYEDYDRTVLGLSLESDLT